MSSAFFLAFIFSHQQNLYSPAANILTSSSKCFFSSSRFCFPTASVFPNSKYLAIANLLLNYEIALSETLMIGNEMTLVTEL
jgi:hypothetical protein